MAYSAITSTGFLMVTFWSGLNSESNNLDPKKRLFFIGLICAVQLGLLLTFKLYFFENITVMAAPLPIINPPLSQSIPPLMMNNTTMNTTAPLSEAAGGN